MLFSNFPREVCFLVLCVSCIFSFLKLFDGRGRGRPVVKKTISNFIEAISLGKKSIACGCFVSPFGFGYRFAVHKLPILARPLMLQPRVCTVNVDHFREKSNYLNSVCSGILRAIVSFCGSLPVFRYQLLNVSSMIYWFDLAKFI